MSENKNINSSKATKKKFFKKGLGSFTLSIIAIAAVVAVNIFAVKLPAKYNSVDISDQKLYTLTERTLAILEKLNEDVTLYYISKDNSTDDILAKTLKQYEAHCSHIKLEYKDPELNPTFTEKYTSDALANNSIIVEYGENYKIINNADMYSTNYDYNTGQEYVTAFDGEGIITSAIAQLATGNMPFAYFLVGHDELQIGDDLRKALVKENLGVNELNLVTVDPVPSDCRVLFIAGPAKDLSAEDLKKIEDYMATGGNVITVSYYDTSEMPNYKKLLEDYAIGVRDGVIFEGDTSRYMAQNPIYIIPEINNSDFTAELVGGTNYVMTPRAFPLVNNDKDDDEFYVVELLSTSDQAYLKTDLENMETYEKTENDESGTFNVALSSTKTSDDVTSNLIAISSEGITDPSVNSAVAGGNYNFIMSIVSKLVEHETIISIPEKSITYNSVPISSDKVIFWRNITMFIVPIVFILAGGIVWLRRRKR